HVLASNVTIDLNGFTISGSQTYGIFVDNGLSNFVAQNGNLSGLKAGTRIFGNNSRVRDLKVDNCADGILVGHSAIVERCSIQGSTSSAIVVGIGAIMSDCNISFNQTTSALISLSDNSTMRNCVISNNQAPLTVAGAISVSVLDCVISNNVTSNT